MAEALSFWDVRETTRLQRVRIAASLIKLAYGNSQLTAERPDIASACETQRGAYHYLRELADRADSKPAKGIVGSPFGAYVVSGKNGIIGIATWEAYGLEKSQDLMGATHETRRLFAWHKAMRQEEAISIGKETINFLIAQAGNTTPCWMVTVPASEGDSEGAARGIAIVKPYGSLIARGKPDVYDLGDEVAAERQMWVG